MSSSFLIYAATIMERYQRRIILSLRSSVLSTAILNDHFQSLISHMASLNFAFIVVIIKNKLFVASACYQAKRISD